MNSTKLIATMSAFLFSTVALAQTAGVHGGKPQAPGKNFHAINLRLRQQMRQIPRDVSAGKLTRDQAKAAMAQLRSIRLQENQYFRQNGNGEITDVQKSQLDQLLDQAKTSK